MGKPYIKLGLMALAIFEIAGIFYMLSAYNKLVSNPENYYKNFLNTSAQIKKAGLEQP